MRHVGLAALLALTFATLSGCGDASSQSAVDQQQGLAAQQESAEVKQQATTEQAAAKPRAAAERTVAEERRAVMRLAADMYYMTQAEQFQRALEKCRDEAESRFVKKRGPLLVRFDLQHLPSRLHRYRDNFIAYPIDLRVGRVGFSGPLRVIQIIAPDVALVSLGRDKTVLAKGWNTDSLVDDDSFEPKSAVWITGTQDYTTVLGGSKRVYVIQPFDLGEFPPQGESARLLAALAEPVPERGVPSPQELFGEEAEEREGANGEGSESIQELATPVGASVEAEAPTTVKLKPTAWAEPPDKTQDRVDAYCQARLKHIIERERNELLFRPMAMPDFQSGSMGIICSDWSIAYIEDGGGLGVVSEEFFAGGGKLAAKLVGFDTVGLKKGQRVWTDELLLVTGKEVLEAKGERITLFVLQPVNVANELEAALNARWLEVSHEFTDRMGTHTTRAIFVELKDSKAVLAKRDGSRIEVPLTKLSFPDVRWIREEAKRRQEAEGKKER